MKCRGSAQQASFKRPALRELLLNLKRTRLSWTKEVRVSLSLFVYSAFLHLASVTSTPPNTTRPTDVSKAHHTSRDMQVGHDQAHTSHGTRVHARAAAPGLVAKPSASAIVRLWWLKEKGEVECDQAFRNTMEGHITHVSCYSIVR